MDLGFKKTSKNKKGLLLVLATAIISGVSIFMNSFGVKGIDSSIFTFSKNLAVGILLFGIILGAGQLKKLKELSKKQWLQLGAIGLIGGSIPFILFFKGLQLTTGTTSAFIHKTLFIYASVFALLFLKEKLNKWFILGAGILLAGNFLMLAPDFSLSTGHLLIIAATLFWAAESVLAKSILRSTTGNIVAFGRMFFGAGFILVFLALTGNTQQILAMTGSQYLWIGITSAFLLLYVMTYYNGLKHVRVSTAASILAVGSPITTILGALFLGSPVPGIQIWGILLTILGVASIVWLAKIAKFITNKSKA